MFFNRTSKNLFGNLYFFLKNHILKVLELKPFATFKRPFVTCGEWWMGWTTLHSSVTFYLNGSLSYLVIIFEQTNFNFKVLNCFEISPEKWGTNFLLTNDDSYYLMVLMIYTFIQYLTYFYLVKTKTTQNISQTFKRSNFYYKLYLDADEKLSVLIICTCLRYFLRNIFQHQKLHLEAIL